MRLSYPKGVAGGWRGEIVGRSEGWSSPSTPLVFAVGAWMNATLGVSLGGGEIVGKSEGWSSPSTPLVFVVGALMNIV